MHDYIFARGRVIHTRFNDLDLISRSQVCQYHKLDCFLDNCPVYLKRCMVATHFEKISHSILCVTDVYLRDITNTIL